MTPLKIAQDRDLLDETRKKIIGTGAIFESAVDECLRYAAAANFKLKGDDWETDEGQTLTEFIEWYKTTHPHAYADRALEGEELEASEIEDAMLDPKPGKLGALAKKLGPMRFKKICDDWGVDVARMKAGTRPEYAADGKTVKRKVANTNPWGAANYDPVARRWKNLSLMGDLVKRLGVEKASQIAKAAGCTLSSTKPNPHYN
jgi:hypothetical protein